MTSHSGKEEKVGLFIMEGQGYQYTRYEELNTYRGSLSKCMDGRSDSTPIQPG